MAVDDWFPFADLSPFDVREESEPQVFHQEDPVGKTRFEINYILEGISTYVTCYNRAELYRCAAEFFRRRRHGSEDKIINVFKKVPINPEDPKAGVETFRLSIEECGPVK